MNNIKPKLKVRNQLWLVVASYFDRVRLIGPICVWYTSDELKM